MAHDFHFVINKKMRKKIINYSKKRKKSISKTILEIINIISGLWKKNDISCRDNCKYSKINWDSHIHLYLEESDYIKLKQLHSEYNVFSIAKLIRKMISFFFELFLKTNDTNNDKVIKEQKKYLPSKFIYNLDKLFSFIEGCKQLSYNKNIP